MAKWWVALLLLCALCGAQTRTGGGGPFASLSGANTWTGAYNRFNLQPWTDVMAAGAKCDDSTDDTAAISAALTALYNQGGGTLMIPPGKFCKIASQLTLPNDGAGVPNNRPLRITSWGPASHNGEAGAPSGGGLDLTFNSTTGKIDTRGLGYLEIDHLTLKDSATDCAPFLFTTNTTIHVHDVEFYGTAGGSSACNDAIILGGTSTSSNGTATAQFQGYGTVIRDDYFGQIKRAVLLQTSANSVQIVDNTVWANSGFPTGGAFELTPAGGGSSVGNYIAGNLIEVSSYEYGIHASSVADNNIFTANSCWDATATTSACVVFDSGAKYNFALDGYMAPGAWVPVLDNDGTNTELASAQSRNWVLGGFQQIIMPNNGSVTTENSGGATSGFHLKNTSTLDDTYLQLLTGSQPGISGMIIPAGGAAVQMFQAQYVDATDSSFQIGKSGDTHDYLYGKSGADLHIASLGAGNVLWLCGGSAACNNYVDASGNHQYTGAGTGPSARHLLQNANHDLAGTCTASGATTCTVTFTTAYTSAPVCTATDATSIVAVKVTPSTTGLVITTAASSSDTFDYHCIGNPN